MRINKYLATESPIVKDGKYNLTISNYFENKKTSSAQRRMRFNKYLATESPIVKMESTILQYQIILKTKKPHQHEADEV